MCVQQIKSKINDLSGKEQKILDDGAIELSRSLSQKFACF
jgi:hypothetical protein